ncbi:MAG: 30S ribosomal protein S6 [Desulfobacterota bacterium]|nr:30S ribosomal protein S6 [Thermodesulfobacteriota bacterium]
MQEDNVLRGYELCLIFHPETPDGDITGLLNSISDLITRQKGSVLKHEKWGKKSFKYPIKKQTKGSYCFLYFMAEPPVLREIDRMVRYNETVLRYTTTALGKHFKPEQFAHADHITHEPSDDTSGTDTHEVAKQPAEETTDA